MFSIYAVDTQIPHMRKTKTTAHFVDVHTQQCHFLLITSQELNHGQNTQCNDCNGYHFLI
jgi:hypothetical protein